MRKAFIAVSIKDKNFTTEFEISEDVQEYQIADEAYRLGLLFAGTQVIAQYGHPISTSEFSRFLQNLNYEYQIKEV